jgi:protein TIF31
MTEKSVDNSSAPAPQEGEEQVAAVPFYSIKVITPNNVTIELPGISALEIPYSIRSLLFGFQESCAYTCYQLVRRSADGVSMPLQDFVDLGTVFGDVETDSIELFMELSDYTIQDAKSHVTFTATLINAPPKLKGRIDSNAPEDEEPSLRLLGANNAPIAQDVKQVISRALSAPKLHEFHNEALFKFAAPGLLEEAEPKVASSFRGITFSGWNPPPPQRKSQGDLFYIEVDSGDGLFQVTAIASGFFVNRSTKSRFDPRPAEHPCFSHELLVTILGHSASIRNYWKNEMTVDNKDSEIDFMTRQFAFGQGDRVFAEQLLQWNAYRDGSRNGDAELDSKHVYSMSRAVDYFSSYGVAGSSATPGAQPKEWLVYVQSVLFRIFI